MTYRRRRGGKYPILFPLLLTVDQHKALKALAKREKLSICALIRRLLRLEEA